MALLHGSLMVIAWLIAASVGVLMPRYMKKSFDGRQMMGKDLWFIVSDKWFYNQLNLIIIALITNIDSPRIDGNHVVLYNDRFCDHFHP